MSPPHVLAVCAVSQVLIILDTTVLSVATPHIGTELGMTELSLPYISHSYTTALAAALLLSGRLADSLGRRRILAWGLAALGLASLIGALAPTALVLLGARFLQGLAAAAVLGANLALLVECFPEQSHRLRALGIWGAAGGSGGALGALLGGIMVEAASWRLALLINVPVVILLLLWPMRRSGTDRHGGAGAVDVAGGCLLAITLVLAVQGTVALTAGATLAGIVFALACLGALGWFIGVEHRATRPLIPLRLFTHRAVLAASVVMFASGGAMSSAFYFMTLQLQRVEERSPLQTGVLFLPLSVATLLAGVLSSTVQRRLGGAGAVRLGTALSALGLAATAVLFALRLPGVAAGAAALFGGGIAFILAGSAHLATAHLAEKDAGFASGMIATSQHFGAVIVLACCVWLSATAAPAGPGPPHYVVGLIGAAGACLAAFAGTFLVPRVDSTDPSAASQ